MDLKKLDSIDTTNKEQVKELQRWLQTRGMLPQGKDQIDGVWGGKTTDGFKQARQDLLTAQATEFGIAEANREANDPVNKAINMGIEVAPYAAGVTAGTAIGRYAFGKPFERMDERQGQSAAKLANDPNIDPKVKQDQLGRMTRRRAVRNVAQFGAPALLGGAGYATQNYIAPMFTDPDLQNTIRTVGTGENAAALTLGLHQMIDTLRRGNPVSDVDEARIRSDARGPGPGGPNTPLAGSRSQNRLLQSIPSASPSAPTPPSTSPAALPPPASPPSTPVRHSDRLRQAATATGAKPGKSKAANVDTVRRNLTAENLPQVAEALNLPTTADRRAVLQRLREISSIGGKMALPIMAAGAAYVAAGSPAEASTGGEEAPGVGDRLTAAGFAGGTAYGVNRLLGALPTAGGPLAATMPMTFDPLEGASYEDTQHNIMAARGDINAAMPWVGRNVLGVTPEEQNAYEMAQVPTPSPARVQRGNQGRQDAEYMRRYLADEPVNMPAGADAGWQDRAASAQPASDDFDAQLAELQQLMTELEGPAEAPQQARRPVVMPSPSMVSPALQNRLLAVR
jgi:hypothetical protein